MPNKRPRAYDLLVYGASGFTGSLRVSVKGDKDPGYGSTSKMIAESGICLARDVMMRWGEGSGPRPPRWESRSSAGCKPRPISPSRWKMVL
jgi:short subunit dehydrogenase-like uncharacterized protein